MGAIQATVFDIHDTKSTPHSLLSSPRLLVSIYARTLEIDIWISMSHALLRESSPLSKRIDGEAVSTRPRAARPLVASVSLWILDETKTVGNTPEFHGNGYLSFDRQIGQVAQSFYPGTTVLIVLNAVRFSLIPFFSISARRNPLLSISRSHQINSYHRCYHYYSVSKWISAIVRRIPKTNKEEKYYLWKIGRQVGYAYSA